MNPPFNPKRVETRKPNGPGTTGGLLFYRAFGNARQVYARYDVWKGRVFLDFDENGELVGVEATS